MSKLYNEGSILKFEDNAGQELSINKIYIITSCYLYDVTKNIRLENIKISDRVPVYDIGADMQVFETFKRYEDNIFICKYRDYDVDNCLIIRKDYLGKTKSNITVVSSSYNICTPKRRKFEDMFEFTEYEAFKAEIEYSFQEIEGFKVVFNILDSGEIINSLEDRLEEVWANYLFYLRNKHLNILSKKFTKGLNLDAAVGEFKKVEKKYDKVMDNLNNVSIYTLRKIWENDVKYFKDRGVNIDCSDFEKFKMKAYIDEWLGD